MSSHDRVQHTRHGWHAGKIPWIMGEWGTAERRIFKAENIDSIISREIEGNGRQR